MSYRDDLVTANRQGRAANVGDANPYVGRGALADMWRLGYQTMLLDRVNLAKERRRFIESDGTDNA